MDLSCNTTTSSMNADGSDRLSHKMPLHADKDSEEANENLPDEKKRTKISNSADYFDMNNLDESKPLLSGSMLFQSSEDGLPCYPVPIKCQENGGWEDDNDYLSIEDDLEDTSIDTIELNDKDDCVNSSIKLNRDISCWVPLPVSTADAWPDCKVNSKGVNVTQMDCIVKEIKQEVESNFVQMFSTTNSHVDEQYGKDGFILSEVDHTAGNVLRRSCGQNGDFIQFQNFSREAMVNSQQTAGRGQNQVHFSIINSSKSGVICDVPQGGSLKAKINEWLKESETTKSDNSNEQNLVPDLRLNELSEESDSRLKGGSCDNQGCDTYTDCSLHFSDLPVEIVQQIFSYFSQYELGCTLAPVCQVWRDLAYDPIHWQSIVLYFREDLELSTLLKMTQRAPLLKSLSLHGGFRLHVEEIQHICVHCPLLQHLDLGFVCGVDQFLLTIVRRFCKHLVSLNVEGCTLVSSACVDSAICKMTKLRHLNMSHCTLLDDANIMCLAMNLEYLERLNIDGIESISDSAMEVLVKHQGKNLTHLDVDGAQMTGRSMQAVSRCPKLYRFSISFAELMTDEALTFLKPMTCLRELRIRKGHDLTASGLFDLFANGSLSELTLLDMTECAELDDQCAIQIASRLGKTLRHLSLEWCWDITDVGLEVIVEKCRSLEHLDLLGIEKLTGQCFEVIPEQLPKLVFLDLTQCNRIIDDIIVDTVRRKPDLKVTNYYGEELFHI